MASQYEVTWGNNCDWRNGKGCDNLDFNQIYYRFLDKYIIKGGSPHPRYYPYKPLITDTQTNTLDW